MRAGAQRSQKGSALMVVLLMALSLSMITITLISAMSTSTKRTLGVIARSEILWRVVSAEAIAKGVISEAIKQTNANRVALTAQHPLFSEQLTIPYADGGGAMIFADATRCFNLNSLGDKSDGNEEAEESISPSDELVALLASVGLVESEARNVTAVAKDFIDRNGTQDIGGAEDSFYAGLPTPFRTAGGTIASVTELRAMKGIHPALYKAISPYLCTMPTTDPMVINVNSLRPVDAPIIVGLTGGLLQPDEAAKLIESRPPGGWAGVGDFINGAESYSRDIDREALSARIALKPAYIEAIAGASANNVDMKVRLLFWVSTDGDSVGVISRELGMVR